MKNTRKSCRFAENGNCLKLVSLENGMAWLYILTTEADGTQKLSLIFCDMANITVLFS